VSRIVEERREAVSPYVTLVERVIEVNGRTEAFHSFDQADYVTVLALTDDGRVPLVRQYRPAVDKVTLELPGGLLDPGEDAAACAARELAEETGLIAGSIEPLGVMIADSGRLQNRVRAFYVADARPAPDWQPEAGVEVVMFDRAALKAAAADGTFDHALHVAIVGLATLKDLI